jgi:hypothetical protein
LALRELHRLERDVDAWAAEPLSAGEISAETGDAFAVKTGFDRRELSWADCSLRPGLA